MTGLEVYTVPGDGWGERIRIRRRGVVYASRRTDNPATVRLEIRRCSTWGCWCRCWGWTRWPVALGDMPRSTW